MACVFHGVGRQGRQLQVLHLGLDIQREWFGQGVEFAGHFQRRSAFGTAPQLQVSHLRRVLRRHAGEGAKPAGQLADVDRIVGLDEAVREGHPPIHQRHRAKTDLGGGTGHFGRLARGNRRRLDQVGQVEFAVLEQDKAGKKVIQRGFLHLDTCRAARCQRHIQATQAQRLPVQQRLATRGAVAPGGRYRIRQGRQGQHAVGAQFFQRGIPQQLHLRARRCGFEAHRALVAGIGTPHVHVEHVRDIGHGRMDGHTQRRQLPLGRQGRQPHRALVVEPARLGTPGADTCRHGQGRRFHRAARTEHGGGRQVFRLHVQAGHLECHRLRGARVLECQGTAIHGQLRQHNRPRFCRRLRCRGGRLGHGGTTSGGTQPALEHPLPVALTLHRRFGLGQRQLADLHTALRQIHRGIGQFQAAQAGQRGLAVLQGQLVQAGLLDVHRQVGRAPAQAQLGRQAAGQLRHQERLHIGLRQGQRQAVHHQPQLGSFVGTGARELDHPALASASTLTARLDTHTALQRCRLAGRPGQCLGLQVQLVQGQLCSG